MMGCASSDDLSTCPAPFRQQPLSVISGTELPLNQVSENLAHLIHPRSPVWACLLQCATG